ncbi:MAG: hypothetical protein J6L91_02995 [Clostridia bacterium]|nr:hypothetical protein [Clostridia bacterium]
MQKDDEKITLTLQTAKSTFRIFKSPSAIRVELADGEEKMCKTYLEAWEHIDKAVRKSLIPDMFTLDNPCGYIVNINHPEILPLYNRYKANKGIPTECALSDKERLAFEWFISHKFSQAYNRWAETFRYLMPEKSNEQVEKIEELDYRKLLRDNQYKTLNEMVEEEKPMTPAERARAFLAKVEKLKKEST